MQEFAVQALGGVPVKMTTPEIYEALSPGSSTASAATLASTSIPGMLKHGYSPKLATGVAAI